MCWLIQSRTPPNRRLARQELAGWEGGALKVGELGSNPGSALNLPVTLVEGLQFSKSCFLTVWGILLITISHFYGCLVNPKHSRTGDPPLLCPGCCRWGIQMGAAGGSALLLKQEGDKLAGITQRVSLVRAVPGCAWPALLMDQEPEQCGCFVPLCFSWPESRALSVPFDDPGWKLRGRTPLSSVAAMVTSCCGLGISYVRPEPRSREEMRTRKANGAGERSRPTMDPASGPSREGSLRQAPVGSWTVSACVRTAGQPGSSLGRRQKIF